MEPTKVGSKGLNGKNVGSVLVVELERNNTNRVKLVF